MMKIRASWLAALAFPLLACGSSSGGSPTSPDAGAPESGSSETGSPDTASPQTIDFTFTVPGVATPITATVTTDPIGRIHIKAYPTSVTTDVKYGLLPASFSGAFSDSFCASTKTSAEGAVGTGTNAGVQKKIVRDSGAVPLRIDVSPFALTLRDAASAAATKAGAPGTSFVIDNPLSFEDISLALDFDADAMSKIIGETDPIVAALRDSLTSTKDTVLTTGQFNGALAAKDVLCDLASKKARFTLSLTGSAGDAPYAGVTTATALTPQ